MHSQTPSKKTASSTSKGSAPYPPQSTSVTHPPLTGTNGLSVLDAQSERFGVDLREDVRVLFREIVKSSVEERIEDYCKRMASKDSTWIEKLVAATLTDIVKKEFIDYVSKTHVQEVLQELAERDMRNFANSRLDSEVAALVAQPHLLEDIAKEAIAAELSDARETQMRGLRWDVKTAIKRHETRCHSPS